MMLFFSVLLGLLPLGGIAWTVANGTIFTVDGLFMTLILLTLSGLFFLNAFWECRDCGYIPGPALSVSCHGCYHDHCPTRSFASAPARTSSPGRHAPHR